MYQKINHSPSWNLLTQQKSSQLLSSSNVQAQNSPEHLTQDRREEEAFRQDNLSVSRLQLKAESGTISSQEQGELKVLQAKMNDFWVQKRETASQFGHNIADISVSSPHRSAIQAKLTIGEPGDKYEQEADSVAAEVVNRINSPQFEQQQAVQRQSELESEEDELQAKLQTKIQREVIPEEEELQASMLQRREATGGSMASTDLESAINSARGGGQSLDPGLQESMGQAMGADFSGVKIHTDSQSDWLNQSIQARAFTTGQDVFFRQGEYNPGSRGGQELIAHELTHVVQQTGASSRPQKKETVSRRITSVARDKSIPPIQRYSEVNDPQVGLVQISDSQEFFKPKGAERELWAKEENIQIAASTMSINKNGILTVEAGESKKFGGNTYHRVVVKDRDNPTEAIAKTENKKEKQQQSPQEMGANNPFDSIIEWLHSKENLSLSLKQLIDSSVKELKNPYEVRSYANGAFAAIRIQQDLKIQEEIDKQGDDSPAPIGKFIQFLNDWRNRINSVNSEDGHKFNFMVTECGGFSGMVMPGKDSTQEEATVGNKMKVDNLNDIPGPWQKHYAAVIMTDKDDRITLESAAGMDKWWFEMYGNQKPDQTFIVKTLLAKLNIGIEKSEKDSKKAAAYVKAVLNKNQEEITKTGSQLEQPLKQKLDEFLSNANSIVK